jgi:hypothetical protein
MRRDQDSINPSSHPDVMVLSHEDTDDIEAYHPYWYARVLTIFHLRVRYVGPGSLFLDFQNLEVLWIRWFGRDISAPGGFLARRLHLVGFVESTDPNAFGFLDPKLIVRGVHLIPAFAHTCDGDKDWRFYYVNMCVSLPLF